MPDDTIPLAQLPRELAAQFTNPPKYRDLYVKIVDGDLPASRQRGRWTVRRCDLPLIAETLGLKAAAPAMHA